MRIALLAISLVLYCATLLMSEHSYAGAFTAAAASPPVKEVVNSNLRVGVKAKATSTTRSAPAVARPPTTTNSCGDPDPIDEQAALALGYATNLVVGGGCGGGGGGGSTPPPPDPVQLPPVIVITSPPTCIDFGNCYVTPPGPPPTIPVSGIWPFPDKIDFIDAIKTNKLFCKKKDEACIPDWSSRMTFSVKGDGSVCGAFLGSQGACNSAVGVEATSNDCRNTNPC